MREGREKQRDRERRKENEEGKDLCHMFKIYMNLIAIKVRWKSDKGDPISPFPPTKKKRQKRKENKGVLTRLPGLSAFNIWMVLYLSSMLYFFVNVVCFVWNSTAGRE